MKLSMARVSVSSCRPHTSSNMALRDTGRPSYRYGFARYRPALIPDEVAKQVGFHQGERKDLLAHAQLEQVELHRFFAERKGIIGGRSGGGVVERSLQPLTPAQQAADAGDEDGEFKGLGQVIVGSGGKAAQDIFGMAARGEHQGWNELTGLTQLGHYREAVDAGQHDIEDHHVESRGLAFEQRQRGFPGVHQLHFPAFRLQIEAQAAGQVLLVFHHENAGHLATGSCSTKVLPRPGPSLSAQARPPWRLATERTMKRPNPVPLTRAASWPGTR